MNRSARKTCFALAAAAALAAACATDTPSTDTSTPAASASGTAGDVRPAPVTAKSPSGQRATAPTGAQPTVKGVPAQRSVYYDYDRFDVKSEYHPSIEAHARYLREHAGARLTIEGNGDERGSREYNLALGQRRAEGVRQMLKLWGAADEQVEAVSFGEEKPRAQGHDEGSWAQNRRSDFVYRRGE
jgi:peptidoglycan-associated lipoprotein